MTDPAPAVEVEGLTINYGRFTALADVAFRLDAGGMLAVLGPNGAGKTTLIKALVGLLPVRRGSIRLLDAEPACHDPAAVSYVPQVKQLDRSFPALTIELVVSGLRRRWPWKLAAGERRLAMELMESLRIADLAGRPASQLSGGQLQRAYLARGLIRKPRLLIFDEPATGIDAPGEEDLYRLLAEYRNDHGATIIMITHDWEVARRHATHALLINRIQMAYGPPAEALTPERLREAFGHGGHRIPVSADA